MSIRWHGSGQANFRLYREIGSREGLHISLSDMCGQLGLKQFGYSKDTLCLGEAQRDLTDERLRRPILSETEFDSAMRTLAHAVRDKLTGDRFVLAGDRGQRFHETLSRMYKGEEVEVSSIGDSVNDAVFRAPRVLPTLTSLRAQTNYFLKLDDWDAILCVAESGQWLLNKDWIDAIRKKASSRFALIVADQTYVGAIEETYGDQIKGRIRWMPWWLHNRHVTVFLSQEKAARALLFERRLRTSNIVPFDLTGEDASIAMDVFVAYWIKAKSHDSVIQEVAIGPGAVLRETRVLLRDLYENTTKDN